MNTKKNHGKTMKFFLWSAFTINLILIIISIIWHIDLVIIAAFLLSFMILIIQKRHLAYVHSDSKNSTDLIFYRYILNLFGNKHSKNDPVTKASIHYTPNPELEKEEWLIHAATPVKLRSGDFSLKVGSNQCSKPTKFGLFNVDIPDISYINKDVLSTLNFTGENMDLLYSIHDTGENKIIKGNVIVKLPVNHNTEFLHNSIVKKLMKNSELNSSIKAIEILLNTPLNKCYSISEMMDINNNRYFNNFHQLLEYIKELRKISNGIPIGIRTGISDKGEFNNLCKVISERGILLDFINIIGEETQPISYSITQQGKLQSSMNSLEHAIAFASMTLIKYRLDKEIKICATGNINNGFELLKLISLGANTCMLTKPSGYFNNLVNEYMNDKNEIIFKNQVIQLRDQIMDEVVKLMEYAGFNTIETIDARKFFRKVNHSTFKSLKEIYFNRENNYSLGKYEVFNHLN